MKKGKKIIILIVSHISVLVVGLVLALWYMQYVMSASKDMMNLASVAHYATMASVEKELAKDQDYRDALLTYLTVLDQVYSKTASKTDLKIYYSDKTLANVRLSLIEDKMGNREAAAKYMKQAIESCPKSGWKDCSSDKLIYVAKRLDENSPFATGKDTEKK
jgi:hypothetical protein